jgi:hypothetical protein
MTSSGHIRFIHSLAIGGATSVYQQF